MVRDTVDLADHQYKRSGPLGLITGGLLSPWVSDLASNRETTNAYLNSEGGSISRVDLLVLTS